MEDTKTPRGGVPVQDDEWGEDSAVHHVQEPPEPHAPQVARTKSTQSPSARAALARISELSKKFDAHAAQQTALLELHAATSKAQLDAHADVDKAQLARLDVHLQAHGNSLDEIKESVKLREREVHAERVAEIEIEKTGAIEKTKTLAHGKRLWSGVWSKLVISAIAIASAVGTLIIEQAVKGLLK